MSVSPDESLRLWRAYQRLQKVGGHGEHTLNRHPAIRPEWIILILEEPHDRYEEYQDGERELASLGVSLSPVSGLSWYSLATLRLVSF